MKYEYRHVDIRINDVIGELAKLTAEGFRVINIEYTKGPPEANGAEGSPESASILLERELK